MTSWKARALAAEQEAASLRTRKPLGRRPAQARTADARLIRAVCLHRAMKRKALAAALGVDPAILSRANATPAVPLAERHREALRAMLPEESTEACQKHS